MGGLQSPRLGQLLIAVTCLGFLTAVFQILLSNFGDPKLAGPTHDSPMQLTRRSHHAEDTGHGMPHASSLSISCEPGVDPLIGVIVTNVNLQASKSLFESLARADEIECFRLRLCVNSPFRLDVYKTWKLNVEIVLNRAVCLSDWKDGDSILTIVVLDGSRIEEVSPFFHVWARAALQDSIGYAGIALLGEQLAGIPFSLPVAVIDVNDLSQPPLGMALIDWDSFVDSADNRGTLKSLVVFVREKVKSRLLVPNFPMGRILARIREEPESEGTQKTSSTLLSVADDPKELLSLITSSYSNGVDQSALLFAVVELAKTHHRRTARDKDPILLSIVDSKSVPRVRNFLCNVASIDDTIADEMTFLCFDENCVHELRRFRPVLNAKYIVLGITDEGDRVIKYSRFVAELLRSGFSVLHFETSVVWFQNCIDFVGSWAPGTPMTMSRSLPEFNVCGGKKISRAGDALMLLRPTEETTFFIEQFPKEEDVVSLSSGYTQMFCRYPEKTLRTVSFIDWDRGPSVKEFDGLSAWLDSQERPGGSSRDLAFIHYLEMDGFAVEDSTATKRGKEFGLWFLDESGQKCAGATSE